jgi:hypothetical protein
MINKGEIFLYMPPKTHKSGRSQRYHPVPVFHFHQFSIKFCMAINYLNKVLALNHSDFWIKEKPNLTFHLLFCRRVVNGSQVERTFVKVTCRHFLLLHPSKVCLAPPFGDPRFMTLWMGGKIPGVGVSAPFSMPRFLLFLPSLSFHSC